MKKTIKQFDLTKEDIDSLMNTDDYIFIPESDYGLGEIRFKDNEFHFNEIPMYGGEPFLSLKTSNSFEMVDYIKGIC